MDMQPASLHAGNEAWHANASMIQGLLSLAGIKSGGYPLTEAVRLLLESAGLSDSPIEDSQGDPVADAAAMRLAAYLGAAFPPATSAWTSRHKHQLRGSARVLQSWLARMHDPTIRSLQR